jgi:hypothetical protein
MKFLYAIVITQLGAAWVLPSQLEKSQVYDPCPDISYDDAYCCAAGPLDDDIESVAHTDPQPLLPLLPASSLSFSRITLTTSWSYLSSLLPHLTQVWNELILRIE